MSESKPIAILNRDLRNLQSALNGLDGYHEAVKDTVIVKPYKISGKVRVRLGKWLRSVTEANKVLSDAHDNVVRQYASDDNPSVVQPDRLADYQADWEKVLNEATEFSHAKIATADIIGENEINAIPVSVLAALAPILED